MRLSAAPILIVLISGVLGIAPLCGTGKSSVPLITQRPRLDRTLTPDEAPRERMLTPDEERIVRNPFAVIRARLRLKARVKRLETVDPPDIPPIGRGDMGWTLPDPQYWREIPAAARKVPDDWRRLPGIRFTNSEIGGVREIWLKQGPDFDQWLLSDPMHDVKACISVNRATRQTYFIQLARRGQGWRLKVAADNCYSCHPSGPRVIRPLNEPRVDKKVLAQFNRLILEYGACKFGGYVDPRLRGRPLTNPACVSCHDGVRRGRLYSIHARTIHFKTAVEGTMPA